MSSPAEGRSIKIRPVENLKEKFVKRVSVAGPDYEAGVKQPLRVWLDEFRNASDAIAEGLRQVAETKRFLTGAERKGQGGWSNPTVRKGPPRWRDETPKSGDSYKEGFKPFHEVLSSLVLEKKRPKGDPANVDARVKPIATNLHDKKLELRGEKK